MPYFRLGGRKSQIRGDSGGSPGSGQDWPGSRSWDGLAARFWSDPEVAIWSRSRLSSQDWSESEGNFSAWVVLKLGGNIGLWKDEISTVPEWVDHHIRQYMIVCV